jgi:hypothetical protein
MHCPSSGQIGFLEIAVARRFSISTTQRQHWLERGGAFDGKYPRHAKVDRAVWPAAKQELGVHRIAKRMA